MSLNRKTLNNLTESEWLTERTKYLTSTDISAIFGLSPYKTKAEVWHQKKSGDIVQIEDNDFMKWGRRAEPMVAEGIAEDQGWKVRPFKEFIALTECGIASSFDYLIEEPHKAILEIKCVGEMAFKNQWSPVDNEAPLHIELQVQHQMLVSGVDRCFIGAFVGGNSTEIIERVADKNIHARILEESAAFWKSIEAGTPPAFDFDRDADFVAALYGHAEPGSLIDSNETIDALALRYKEAAEAERDAKKIKDATKAELLTLIGDAEKCKGEQFTISAGMVGEAEIKFTRKPYRNFRISFRKEK